MQDSASENDESVDMTQDSSSEDDALSTQYRSRSANDRIRIRRLQDGNTNLLEDIEELKAERNKALARKDHYKRRLRKLEAHVESVSSQAKEAVVHTWREVLGLVKEKVATLEAQDEVP